ncbi:hypothetical protein A3A60_03520 [Candidatus Curtissbacteria bacterium RIFCSPLOWO2_01_FULL_42_26]|uniref:ABM domain-containing protein n=1 Tax=Candidatus Curtissbacteria bacterium RIFCSPLOWO2_01_FULL_42_26 TaxID=1797729 RepID=A0A1F5I4D5_9BACT|nr:MAG: hypothetical protein A3A60_03520 [Candidatus Curtissbacteria bacterium RIFCSPLOWO2_01_FULL_42_26]
MYNLNQLFTSGIWVTKEGKEKDFVKEWEAFANWSVRNKLGSQTPYLLQDINNPRYSISFGPWPDLAIIEKWRQTKEFQAFVKKVKDLCEKLDPSTLKVVALGKEKG